MMVDFSFNILKALKERTVNSELLTLIPIRIFFISEDEK